MDNCYNVSFNGGFLIKKPSTKMWNSIKKSLPKKKCIIENYNQEGDKFFAIKTHYDSDILQILSKKRVKKESKGSTKPLEFVFYPDINLKNRLDADFPNEAKEIIDSQDRVISTRKELKEYIKRTKKPFSLPTYRWEPNDHIAKTLKVLGLNENECIIEIKDGITVIRDKTQKLIAKASPNGKKGTNFIYIAPKNKTDKKELPRRIAVSNGGEVWEFSVLGKADFEKNFLRNVKIDLGRQRPQK